MRMKLGSILLGAMLIAGMSGCSKQPFQAVQSKPGKGLLYVYWPAGSAANTTYDVIVNDEIIGKVHGGSYIARDVATGKISVKVRNSDHIKAHVETSVVELETSEGSASYLKIGSPFAVSQPANAAEEIKQTVVWDGLMGSPSIDKQANNVQVVSQPAPVSVAAELERLVALKEKGAITEEEYEILKARVIEK